MTEFLLKLLGGGTQNAVNIAEMDFAFRGELRPTVLVMAGAMMALVVWMLYRSDPVRLSWPRKYALILLRIAFVALLLFLIARPVLAMTIEGTIRRALLVLVDTSLSMQIKDLRVDPEDRKRAAIAQGSSGDSHTPMPRIDLVKAVLQNQQLDLLGRLEHAFDVQPFAFGRGLLSLAATNAGANGASNRVGTGWISDLAATNSSTALGDALRDLIRRKKGQPVAGVLVISDGANNSGGPVGDAAASLKSEGVPAYVYGVGVRSPRDLLVANVFAPDVSFVDDEVHVGVRVRSQGLAGQEAAITLKLAGEAVVTRPVSLTEGEQLVPLTFAPRKAGNFELEALIEPRDDEAVRDNNRQSQQLRVVDGRLKVLLVDQSPRWEFRYLQAMLLRDRRVELKCFLAEADPAVARAENTPYLAQFPANREDLFKYDVVILGDLDPKLLSANQMENLTRLVADFGGGLVVVAGRRATPHAYRQTVLERLLPVELDALALPVAEGALSKPSVLQLTAAGRGSTMLRLAEKEEDNVQLWKELPPVYWVSRVARAKPAAEILLVDADPLRETRHGKMPVVALQQYGLGQVLYVGTDNTWRWRRNVGDQYYTAFWGQSIQRLALQRLLGGSKRTQLATDRQNYLAGDKVPIYARVYGAGFEPIEAAIVHGASQPKAGGGQPMPVPLRAVPDQPGLFRGEFIAASPGQYIFSLEQDPATILEFSVNEPQFELGDSAMNEPLLRELANVTGGLFFREEDLKKLPESILQRSAPVQSMVEVDLWSSPACFLLLLTLISAEWVLRKRWYLK